MPLGFPERMALAWETGGRIPATYHKLDNAALCLGSRVRLHLQTAGSPSVLRFVERCLIPYLYGYSHYFKTGKMPFGELAHGELGSLQDLASLLGMEMGPAHPLLRTCHNEAATREQATLSLRQQTPPRPLSQPEGQHASRTSRAPGPCEGDANDHGCIP